MEIRLLKHKTKKTAEQPRSRLQEIVNKVDRKIIVPKINMDVIKYVVGYTGPIPLDLISADPEQPRKEFDEEKLKELADSIAEQGMIQIPAVRKVENKFVIVAGERRYRAHLLLCRDSMKCTIIKTDRPEELALVENIQRENLNPIEEAEGIALLQKKYEYTQEELAKRVGKSKSTISEILSINKLPEEIKKEIRRVELPKRALYEIARKHTDQEKIATFKRLVSGEANSDDLKKEKRERKPNAPLISIAFKDIVKLSRSLMKIIKNKKTIDFDSGDGVKFFAAIEGLKTILDGINKDSDLMEDI